MPTELVVSLVGVAGIILGALVTHFLTRKKTEAEIEKIKAETEKVRNESEKLRAEIIQLSSPIKKERNDQKLGQTLIATVDTEILEFNKNDVYKESPSPIDIASELDALSEYQKDKALESYKDIKVKWRLTLVNMTFKDDVAELGLVPVDNASVPVLCNVKIQDHPEIKLLKRNCKLWVFGTIERVSRSSGYAIWLSNCSLKIE